MVAPKATFLVAGMLLSGTIATVSQKAIQNTEFPGLNRAFEKFGKNCSPTLFMFFGELMCLAIFVSYISYQRVKCRQTPLGEYPKPQLSDREHKRLVSADSESLSASESDALLAETAAEDSLSETDAKIAAIKKVNPLWFLLFASCDMFGTTFATLGLLRCSASVYQMMRGSIVVFTAVLSVIFLKRKLQASNWIGISVVVSGLMLVGSESFLGKASSDSTSSASQTLLGIVFIICGQFCNAIQMVLEETVLQKRKLEALYVVGMEGLWGTLLCICVFLPIANSVPGPDVGNRLENVADTLAMLSNSSLLVFGLIGYMLAICGLNSFGLSVSKYLSSVHRTLIDAVRVIIVWTVQLIIYYAVTARQGYPSTYGEKWSSSSYLQLLGFLFLVIGSMIYNNIITITRFNRPSSYETPGPLP